jgi:transcriptional regulator with XRE-family HTH domain
MSTSKANKDPELREALAALMELNQITSLKEVAQRADCALSHLSSSFRGEASMSAVLIRRICVAFHLHRSEFFRMGEMRHRLNEEIAQMIGDSAEEAVRRHLDVLIAEDPQRARRVLSEYLEEQGEG